MITIFLYVAYQLKFKRLFIHVKGLFPLAFVVVDSEMEDNWTWFLQNLRKVVGSDRTITFISDRNQGLIEAVSSVFYFAHHAFCLQHLKENLRDKLSSGYTQMNLEREWL